MKFHSSDFQQINSAEFLNYYGGGGSCYPGLYFSYGNTSKKIHAQFNMLNSPDGCGGGSALSNNQFSESDVWIYLVAVLDRNENKIKLYINGIKQDSMVNISSTSYITYNTLDISQQGLSYRNFNGTIDDVRIYNRALSDQEIKAIYEATK